MRSWQILTGEYPPQPGGIADYTGRLVEALKTRGEDVQVWAPGQTLSRGFGFSGLRSIAEGLAATRAAGREPIVLVQYAPNAFGMRGANLLLCAWLLLRARWHGDDVRVMFHEPFFYFARQALGRNALALVHRIMASLLLMASRLSYVSTGSWEGLLSHYAGSRRTFVRLPISATVTPGDNPAAIARIRESISAPDAFVVGHFGTYPDDIARELQPVVAGVLGSLQNATVLLIGRKSDDFRRRFIAAFPQHESRIVATGELTSDRLADHLRACDVLVQPYPDGATTRRTSLMAALVCGVPTVTTVGCWSEPLWQSACDVVELAPAGNAAAVVHRCRQLANDPVRRRALGAAASSFYERHFSLERTLTVLVGPRPGDPVRFVEINLASQVTDPNAAETT